MIKSMQIDGYSLMSNLKPVIKEKVQFWRNTLNAQLKARRELQHQNWMLENISPKLVHKVADGLVKHAIKEIRKLIG